MPHPINVLADAIRAADGDHKMGAGQLADVVADALTDERIVDNAAMALTECVERLGDDSPFRGTVVGYDVAALYEIARVVLRSVGGAA